MERRRVPTSDTLSVGGGKVGGGEAGNATHMPSASRRPRSLHLGDAVELEITHGPLFRAGWMLSAGLGWCSSKISNHKVQVPIDWRPHNN